MCLTLVVLSFFSTDGDNKSSLSAAGVTNAVISAGEIVHYMSGICVEKPEVCVKGAETIGFLSERTREGAKVAFQLLEGQLGGNEQAAAPVNAEPAVAVRVQAVQSQEPELTPDSAISTGTIAKLADEPQLARIPVPMKRPANL